MLRRWESLIFFTSWVSAGASVPAGTVPGPAGDVLVHRCSSPTAASTSADQLSETVQGCMLTENNPPTSGPTRCKPMLFKGQWWLIINSLTNAKTDNIQILQVTEHNTLKDDLEINFCSKVELWIQNSDNTFEAWWLPRYSDWEK